MTSFPVAIFDKRIENATDANSMIGLLKESIYTLEDAARQAVADPDLQVIVDDLNNRADKGDLFLFYFGEHSNTVSRKVCRFCVTQGGKDITWHYPKDRYTYECSVIDKIYYISFTAPPELLYERKI